MGLMRTGNPTLSDKVFMNAPRALSGENTMTVSGAVNCTAVLLGLCLVSASWTWALTLAGQNTLGYTVVGAIGGLIAVIVATFKKEWAPVLAPAYALLEGLVLGGISAMYEALYSGIVVQAVGLTFGTMAGLLLAYRSGWIKATENFRLGIFAATAAIGLYYLAAMVCGMFFHFQLPLIHDNGPLGIAFSLFVVGIAALNLVLDFDFIENGERHGLPSYMNWFAALGLMVTLVWLYVEILRLLAKLRSR